MENGGNQMKRFILIMIIFISFNILAAENIFLCFSNLNTSLREQYKIENQENQFNINKIVSMGYERVGIKVDLSNNNITVYDNFTNDYEYTFENKEIAQDIFEYLSINWIPEDKNIKSFELKSAIIEKADPNSCGIFGNDYFITLDLVLNTSEETMNINETIKEFVKNQE